MTKREFDPHAFLSTIARGRQMMSLRKSDTIFSQDDHSDGSVRVI
jgi:hypothetical protein